MINDENIPHNRYIYAWYYVNTNEIFYIGKGINNRWKDIKGSRNQFFKNIINKYLNTGEISVKKLYENLGENESLNLERKLIKQYWELGQCKTNIHEGGCGGWTGNYNSIERSEKLRAFGKTRTGQKNPNWGGGNMSAKGKQNIINANKGKKLSLSHIEKLKRANIGRIKSIEERKKLSNARRGLKESKEWITNNVEAHAKFRYFILFDNNIVFETIYKHEVDTFCSKTYDISRTIIARIIDNSWKPTFDKYKNLSTKLNIIKVDKSVTTIPDECKGVE